MALPPRERSSSQPGFPELSEELATARDALLLFADSEGVLRSLVCDPADPDCRFPDLAAVRSHATVDELLQWVARIPGSGEGQRGDEADSLYPALLELAEIFDILIDQYSLVYGDAVALAESMAEGWHAMAGCYNHDPTPEEATLAVKQVSANLYALPGVLDAVGRLPLDARGQVAARFAEQRGDLWKAEARYFALHAVDAWLPQGLSDQRIARAVEPSRELASGAQRIEVRPDLTLAASDLLLARLVKGVSRDLVVRALEEPFAPVLRRG